MCNHFGPHSFSRMCMCIEFLIHVSKQKSFPVGWYIRAPFSMFMILLVSCLSALRRNTLGSCRMFNVRLWVSFSRIYFECFSFRNLIRAPKNQRKLFLYRVFRQPFGSLGNGWYTVSRVLFRRRELTEPH